MSEYYGLMTGLPDISLSNVKQQCTIEMFKEECGMVLSDEDIHLLNYFYLKIDALNVVRLLKNEDSEMLPLGVYGREELLDLITFARESEEYSEYYPSFLLDFVRSYDINKDKEGYIAEDAALLAFYQYSMTCKNKFIADWSTLNYNISNVLAALIARKYGWKTSQYVLGDDEIADMLRMSKSRDFDLGKEYDFIEDLIRIADESDPVLKEKKIDAFKWNWLDDKTFDDFFSIQAVFAYLCKLEMLERWDKLDVNKGKETFRQIIESLRSAAEVPSEFRK